MKASVQCLSLMANQQLPPPPADREIIDPLYNYCVSGSVLTINNESLIIR